MPFRNQHFKLVLVLVVAQLGCLAVGLWLYDRVVTSMVGRTTEQEFLDSLPTVGVIAWFWTGTLLAIVVYMIAARFADLLSSKSAQADLAALAREQSLTRTRDALVFGLGKLAEAHDQTTGCHLERVSLYASLLASTLRHHLKYRDVATPEFVRLIGISSVLHDIGKTAIESPVLAKPGHLTEAERARMEQHTTIGGEYLEDIGRRLGTSNFLQMAREIAVSHHERWDGTGYPNGLAGDQIPLAARIVAVADVYEGLSSLSDYKPAFPHERCVEQIVGEAGKQFDPDLVAAFLKVEGSFRRVACQYGGGTLGGPTTAPETPDAREDRQCTGLFSVGAASQEDWSPRAGAPCQE